MGSHLFKYFHIRHLSFPYIYFPDSKEYYLEVSEHMVLRIMYVMNSDDLGMEIG